MIKTKYKTYRKFFFKTCQNVHDISKNNESFLNLQRKVVFDADGQTYGRFVCKVAMELMKNNKIVRNSIPTTIVEVTNLNKIQFLGQKEKIKTWKHHTGYPGGFREQKIDFNNPIKLKNIFLRSVKGMLPKNRIYRYAAHNLVKIC